MKQERGRILSVEKTGSQSDGAPIEVGNMDRTQPTLVTGGTGFLGRHIVERLLDEGRSVTVLARRPLESLQKRGVRFVCTPLEAGDSLTKACEGIESVFHVAAKVGVWGAPKDFERTNVGGTQALLDACRAAGVRQFIHTSTPSVVYNGQDLKGADESLPLTTACPSPYPLTKAKAETLVRESNSPTLRTCALRPHLIWGPGDPHLVPRVLERARAGRLRIVGDGKNLVDMVHVSNATDAHLLAETSLRLGGAACGKAYFITNGEPVNLWAWINELLVSLGEEPVTRRIPLPAAKAIGAVCETLWRCLPLAGEPPMTRFVAAELAKHHWFSIEAARKDLGYQPRISMAAGTAELIAQMKQQATKQVA